jgi:hypothetical protein
MNDNSSMFLLLRDQNYYNSKRSLNSLAKKSVTYENLNSDSLASNSQLEPHNRHRSRSDSLFKSDAQPHRHAPC